MGARLINGAVDCVAMAIWVALSAATVCLLWW